MSEVTLYHVPPSFYSQIARIALSEKGIRYRGEYILPGPPRFESYAPWYMRLNPGGTVPTLVDGATVVADSFAIARYVDERFSGPRLTPADPDARAAMERWLDRLQRYPIRELSYGGEIAGIGGRINRMRVAVLRWRRRRHPEMAAIYDAKIADIEGFAARAVDPAHTDALRDELAQTLDELDAVLSEHPWIAGDAYSLADALWTVGVARFRMLGLDPLVGRPALAQWYGRVHARPSFVEADVWERFKPAILARVVVRKLAPLLAVLVGVAIVVAVALWRACGCASSFV
ncbi:MAG: glutathione S-transferase family protein [Myxococcales bacterium]|nr:glutathione S-transferase family protein [Myxococcales bacterium]